MRVVLFSSMRVAAYCRIEEKGHLQASTECKKSKGDGINSIELGILYDF